ncbi:MAG: O-antigen ligase family protein [Candidatus Komeilibacteria bacterium]|nr:O-antigen ligase family protein [Candidatus Komeilibacteria bacterium]
MLEATSQKWEKILKYFIIIGSFLVVAVPLVVVPVSYFPYIIQKTIILRILMELIFAAYLVLALGWPEYRPKKSIILGAVLAFAAVMLITTFTSQSIFRSWWGNWERSFGTFNYLHYFLWFIILISVFKKTVYWNRILNLTLLVSLAMSLYSLSQRLGLGFTFQSGLERVNGTIGNASFLASYLLFHLFIALLFLVEKAGLKWKFYYLAVFIVDLAVLLLTATRGAQLALFASVLVFIIFVFVFKIWRQKAIKLLLAGCLLLAVLMAVAFIFKNTDLVKNNYWLSRLTSYSFSDNTVQTRLHAWRWGLEGFRDNLLVGVGPENFQIVFNKYFQPDFYNYSGNEIWFDRAHNTLVDMASTMGIFGLLSYLAIFGAIGLALYKLFKSGNLSALSFLIIFLLFFSYFIQNLLVFDSLNSLIVFYLIVAYLAYLLERTGQLPGNSQLKQSRWQVKPYFTLPLAGVLFLVLFFTVNLPEIRANKYVYNAYIDSQYGHYQKSVQEYNQVHQVAVNRLDPAILLSSSLSEMIGQNPKIAAAAVEVADIKKAIGWLDEAISLDPKNMFLYYLQTKNYMALTELTQDVKYLEKGLEFADKSMELRPGEVRNYWVLAQLYLYGSQPEKALTYLEQAQKMNDRLPETYFYLSVVYQSMGNQEKYFNETDQMIDHNFEFFSADQVKKLIPHYDERKDLRRLIYLYSKLTGLQPQEPNYWLDYVNLLAQDKQYDRALKALQEAAGAIPAFSSRAYGRYQEILQLKETGTTAAGNLSTTTPN